MEAPRDDANTPNVRSKTQTALPYLSMSPTPLKYARARPRTTINNFTPNHARAHGVQVNASMGGLSACVRDVVVVFRRSGRPRRTVRRGYPGRATMMAFSSTMSTVRVHATRRAHGWEYFRSREMGSIARARRRRCRAYGWMDGWMDGWDGVWGLRV